MATLLSVLMIAAATALGPLAVDVERDQSMLRIDLELAEPVPEVQRAALTSGARTEVQYLVRVYAPRWLIPDRRIWKGTARSVVSFDAITGRHRCQLIVNGTTTHSIETEDDIEARNWLIAPPTIEVQVPKGRRGSPLRLRARAVFSRGTTWLVFPTVDGTEWHEQTIAAPLDQP